MPRKLSATAQWLLDALGDNDQAVIVAISTPSEYGQLRHATYRPKTYDLNWKTVPIHVLDGMIKHGLLTAKRTIPNYPSTGSIYVEYIAMQAPFKTLRA